MEINRYQEILGIPVTGTLDEFTEAALRNFQLKNNIPVTGIFDLNTTSILDSENGGFADTDSLKSIINNYPLPTNQYFGSETKKEAIFLHHTAGWNNPYQVVDDWKNRPDLVATSYVIGGINPTNKNTQYDGEIIKCFPEKYFAWHLGIGNTNLHRQSIGIELCNFGYVTLENGKYRTYKIYDGKKLIHNGIIVDPELVVDLKREFRGYRYYVKYSEQQIRSLKWLIEDISKRHQIDPKLGLKERLLKFKDPFQAFEYDENIRYGNPKGIYSHTNVSPKNKWGNWEKWDIFPQPEIIEMLLSL